MSVEDWARHEAARIYSQGSGDGAVSAEWRGYAAARAQGIVHAFDALLSDEACDEIAKVVWGSMPGDDRAVVRAALQAAVRAVTEGDTSE